MEAHLWVHLRSRCDIFDCPPEELLYVHAHNSCDILLSKVQLILTEIPDQLSPSQVEECVSMFAELLQPGGRGIVFHSKQGSRMWSDALLKHPGLCMEKDVLSVVRGPQAIPRNAVRRHGKLKREVERVLHFWVPGAPDNVRKTDNIGTLLYQEHDRIGLMMKLLVAFADAEASVVDPFVGVGNVAMAIVKLHSSRKFYGCDSDVAWSHGALAQQETRS